MGPLGEPNVGSPAEAGLLHHEPWDQTLWPCGQSQLSRRRRQRPTRVRSVGGDGGESNSPSRTLCRRPLRACPMVCRRPPGRASAPCRTVQSRAPRSGLSSDYATLIRDASPLHDASTIRGEEMASTLTLLPLTRRGRESTGGCQVLRFAACLTRPDGTSARVPRRPSPVESTHPQDRTAVRRTLKCYHEEGAFAKPDPARTD